MQSKLVALSVSSIVAVAFSSTAYAVTETNYDALNFNTNSGYVRGYGIISTSQPTPLRWQGNDPYNSGTDEGETDLVARATGYTPSPLANSSLIQGGLGVSSSIFPGTTDVNIWKSFTPTSLDNPTVSFFVEWSLVPSLEAAPYDLADTFAFDLRNAANTQSLLRLQLTPGINIQANSYTLQSIAAGSPTDTLVDLGYQGLFQIQVDMTGSAYDLSLSQINASTRAVITNYTLVTNASLATGLTALDFATIMVDWDLASGNNIEPGSNYMIANQFQVTSTGTVIPEPGTWAAAFLLLGIGGMYAYRRRARLASEAAVG
ncbi:MAG: hypothetical protein ACO3L2_05650 [Chthoniobacterales bacterium]